VLDQDAQFFEGVDLRAGQAVKRFQDYVLNALLRETGTAL
jgi:hypothetical protein